VRTPVQLTEPASPERLGVNTTPNNLRSASGPIAAADWNNPSSIAARLTQTPAGGATVNSPRRCGPASLLGATVLQGRDATARLADNLARGADAPAPLRAIAARLRAGSSSFEDLSTLQDEMFAQGNRRDFSLTHALDAGRATVRNGQGVDGLSEDRGQFEVNRALSPVTSEGAQALSRLTGRDIRVQGNLYYEQMPATDARTASGGFTYSEALELARTTHGAAEQHAMGALGDRYMQLHIGESIAFSARGGPASTRDDHFIVLGRDRQGRPFLYNPDPSPGDATLTLGSAQGPQPAAFLTALAEYDQRRLTDTPAVTFHPPG
jgi:hypothetical protein